MVAKKEYEGAIAALYNSYVVVMEINLCDNSFKVLKKGGSFKKMDYEQYSDWILSFPKTGNIFEDDLNAYLVRTDIENLRHLFASGYRNMSFRFRRKEKDGFRWSFMEYVKADDFTKKNQMVYLYIKDIDENCTMDTRKQRELEYLCSHDALTKLRNYYAYKEACSLFMEIKRGQSVGVIFSDLNGLKIINDIQGHKTGNEYICQYSEKLREFFPYNDLFRISGDEFLTIFVNESEREVFAKTKALRDWLREQPVPMASIGVAWIEHPEDITEVTKLAESEMYQEKRRFYKAHPEYKREVVEASFSQEMNAIILDLAKAYPTLGIIDLKNDTYRLIKMDARFGKKIVPQSYTEYVDEFMKEYVSMQSQKDIARISGSKNLKRVLMNQESVCVNFQLKTGEWRQITYRVIERTESSPVKVVFYASDMDQFLSEALDQDLEKRTNYELLEGLSIDYTLISWIDTEKQKIHIKKNKGLPIDLIQAIQEGSFDDARNWFARNYVLERDRSRFLKETSLVKIVEKLKNQEYYNVYTRTTPVFHQTKEPSFSNFYFFQISNDSNRIVFATRNITELIKKTIQMMDDDIDLLDVVMDQETIDRLMHTMHEKIQVRREIVHTDS